MGLCLNKEEVVDLAVKAAERALDHWSGDRHDIQMIVVGTESGLDVSRPLSAWVADRLKLTGAVRSYEVKHACYGGTLALRQAYEWKRAKVSSARSAALVIAVDICRYAPGHPAEPTQGAGAVACIVRHDELFTIEPQSYPYSIPTFDFWRPLGHDFPMVEGKTSLDSYFLALEKTFEQYIAHYFSNPQPLEKALESIKYLCFHTPFPKMVMKAFTNLGKIHHLSDDFIDKIFKEKIEPTLQWSSLTGNCYTASLWVGVARALCLTQHEDVISAFSYGSGFGAELLILQRGRASCDHLETSVQKDFQAADKIDSAAYFKLQTAEPRRRGLEKS